MPHTFTLVVVLLTVQSSYLRNLEEPRQVVPDTVQFWFTPDRDWRIKTFALDHDIHVHVIRETGKVRTFSIDDATANSQKHYGDVIDRVVVVEIVDPTDKSAVSRLLSANHLSGELEIGASGVAFYNPDRGKYRTQSTPE